MLIHEYWFDIWALGSKSSSRFDQERYDAILHQSVDLQETGKEVFDQWGCFLETTPMEVHGRTLEACQAGDRERSTGSHVVISRHLW